MHLYGLRNKFIATNFVFSEAQHHFLRYTKLIDSNFLDENKTTKLQIINEYETIVYVSTIDHINETTSII